jgi:predicted DNA-binding transcriptional regulator YafY
MPGKTVPLRKANIEYTNYKGVRKVYTVLPIQIFYCQGNAWHPEPHWCMEAKDLERGVVRQFKLADIHVFAEITP